MNQRRVGVLLSYLNMLAKNIVSFIYLPFLIRALGQSEYGLYQMSNSIIGTLNILSLGFGSAYIRFYAQAKEKGNSEEVSKLNGLYFIIFSIASLLSILSGAVLIANINTLFKHSLSVAEIATTEKLMLLMVFNIAITFISSIFDSYIMANQMFRFQRSRQLLQTVIAPVLTIPLLLLGLKSISVVLVQTIIYVIFLYLNIHFSISKLHMRFRFKGIRIVKFKEIAIFSIYILANDITDQINWNIPNFLLGMLSGAKSVAIFGVASQIKTVFINLSTTLSGVFVPQINTIVARSDDNDVLTEIMVKVGRIQMLLVMYIFGGFLVVGQYFIKIWAGSGYSDAYLLSILLILPLIIPLVQNVGIEIQRAKNRHRFRSLVYLIFALLNLVLTYGMIKQIGIYGAAIGGLVTMLISNGFLMNWYYSRRIKLSMGYFWKQISLLLPQFFIATVCCLIAAHLWPVNSFVRFIIIGILFSLLYFGYYLLFGMSALEKQWLSQAKSRFLKS